MITVCERGAYNKGGGGGDNVFFCFFLFYLFFFCFFKISLLPKKNKKLFFHLFC